MSEQAVNGVDVVGHLWGKKPMLYVPDMSRLDGKRLVSNITYNHVKA